MPAKKTTTKKTTKTAPVNAQKPAEAKKPAQKPKELHDRLSIIIPNYNNAKTLGKLLDELTNQKMSSGREVEIIVVDDGSTDESRDVISEHGLVRAIYQENKGVSAARNAGLELATGKYIAFVDSDDFVEPNYTQVIFNTLDRGVDYALFPWRDKKTGDINFLFGNENQILSKAVWVYAFNYDCIKGELFNESLVVGEDYDWLKRVLPGKKRELSDTPIYIYDWDANPNSLSKRNNRGEFNK